METSVPSRRTVLKGGGAALAGLTVLRVAGPAAAFPGRPDEVVIPWDDQPADNPVPNVIVNQLVWEQLDSWLTPIEQFFIINHYGRPDPAPLTEEAYRLAVDGLVARPQSLTLADLKARRRREVDFTIECSGNTGLPFFIGGVGNAHWAGTPLASLLDQAGVLDEATDVVFWGADAGEVTIRDNSGVLGAGTTGQVEPDATGGLDLTITEHFVRSMSVAEARSPDNLLCYEMNGEPLAPDHGFPVRLIAPGWYGVANVKWLTRIEVLDHRWAGRFMARDYVTIREQRSAPDGQNEIVWTFTTVSHDRLKSVPARVTRRGDHYRITGVAWGAPIAKVEVQIDDGPWTRVDLVRHQPRRRKSPEYAWVFWTLDWRPAPGRHSIRSRATDVEGSVQPTPLDLANKVTYWESNGQVTRFVVIP